MYIGLHVKDQLFLSYLMKFEFFNRFSKKHPNIKFQENQSSGSRDFPCGHMDRHNKDNSCFLKFTDTNLRRFLPLKVHKAPRICSYFRVDIP